jgi:hypothetical protein
VKGFNKQRVHFENFIKEMSVRQYRTSLHNKLKNTPDMNNINEEWERIKEAKTDAANKVIQIQSRTP